MTGNALEFFVGKWLEITTLIVACGGLVYAHLAYRTSGRGLAHAKQAELTSLRLQTKASLGDAEQSLVSLQLNCAIHHAATESERLRRGPTLAPPEGMLGHSPSDKVAAKGRKVLQDLEAGFANIDQMGLQELEESMRLAKVTSLKIQALASELTAPS